MTRAAYIRREAVVSALVNAAISAGFVLAVFGMGPVPVWGLPGYVSDFVPQGFMVGLMAGLVPSLLARRAVVRGAIEGVATIDKWSNALLVAVFTGLLCAAAGSMGAAALLTVSETGTVPFALALGTKVIFGAGLGWLVTRQTLARLLHPMAAA